MLTRISRFWFDRTRHIVPNHLTAYPLERAVPDADERRPLVDRSMVVKRLRALPIEAVVRGYLIGSGWKDYEQSGGVCGIALPVRAAAGGSPAGADLHARDQSRTRRAR